MVNMREVIFGSMAVMASNTLQLATTYSAKYQMVTPGQILMVRGVMQIVLFGMLAVGQHIWSGESIELSRKTLLTVVIANSIFSVAQLSIFTAVKLMPLSDCVTLAFTSPLFAIVANALILR